MKILGVDDDIDFNYALEDIFKNDLNQIRTTSRQSVFFETYDQMKPDICLVDINLEEDGEGKLIVEKIRNLSSFQPKIIALSRIDAQEEINEIIHIGADDFVSKPLDEFMLTQKMDFHLNKEERSLRNTSFLPKMHKPCIVNTTFNLLEINEDGPIFLSNNYVSVNSKIKISGDYLNAYGINDSEVIITWVRKEGDHYLIGGSFHPQADLSAKSFKMKVLEEQIKRLKG
ncbi:MAG: DNA-binding response OmpR family regulator [Bacteriovoracaceae bacterium]|jgi:DNA-binding response OmpR family regulator